MDTWLAYWRTNNEVPFRTTLYGFPRPGQEPPVLAHIEEEVDCPETRWILIDQLEKNHGVKIKILE